MLQILVEMQRGENQDVLRVHQYVNELGIMYLRTASKWKEQWYKDTQVVYRLDQVVSTYPYIPMCLPSILPMSAVTICRLLTSRLALIASSCDHIPIRLTDHHELSELTWGTERHPVAVVCVNV